LAKRVTHLVVFVAATGDVPDRLLQVAAPVRPPGGCDRPTADLLLGLLFRALSAVGGLRWYMTHQHQWDYPLSKASAIRTSRSFLTSASGRGSSTGKCSDPLVEVYAAVSFLSWGITDPQCGR
jgi:hypothetical protein